MSWSAVWDWVRSWQFGTVAAWVAVAPAVISAATSVRQARKATAAACDAREALAMALRPIFAFGADRVPSESGTARRIGLTNTSSFAAVDVTFRVTASGGEILGEGTAERIMGKVPGVLFGDDEDLEIDVTLPHRAREVGQRLALTMSARFSDEQGIQRWEQRGQLTWESRQAGFDGKLFWETVEYQHGEPRRYVQAK